MDLLFKRYASPFILVDQYIRFGELSNFIDEFIINYNEDELYNLWLHKVHDKGYLEFKSDVDIQVQADKFTPQQKEETIREAKEILNSFNPEGGE